MITIIYYYKGEGVQTLDRYCTFKYIYSHAQLKGN